MQSPTKRKWQVAASILLFAAAAIAITTYHIRQWRRESSKEGLEEHVAKMFEGSMNAGLKPEVNLSTTGNGIWTGTVSYEGGLVYRVTLDTSNRNKVEWVRD